jgi:hypothetical protein
VLGVVAVGVSAYQIQAEHSLDIKPSKILRIDAVPPIPDLTGVSNEDDRQQEMALWLRGVFDASVRVNVGRNGGVNQGDLLAVLKKDVLPKEPVGNLDLGALADDSSATLRVVSVFDQESICQLDDFVIKAFLARMPADIPAGLQLYPIDVNYVAFPVPSAEAASYRDQQDLETSATEEGLAEAVRIDRLSAASRAAADFMALYPNSFFAPNVMFNQAYLSWWRGRTDEAIETYEAFIRRYPRSPSVEGARDSIASIKRGETPGSSGGSPAPPGSSGS